MSPYFDGKLSRVRIYPYAFSSEQMYRYALREQTWWGRLLNDFESLRRWRK